MTKHETYSQLPRLPREFEFVLSRNLFCSVEKVIKKDTSTQLIQPMSLFKNQYLVCLFQMKGEIQGHNTWIQLSFCGFYDFKTWHKV